MKALTFPTVAVLFASLTALAPAGFAAENATLQVAQNSRAEQTCVSAARNRGFRVEDVVAVNEYAGGAEVIMEVRQGRNSSQIGCDYSSANRGVELYELEESYDSSGDEDDDSDNQYGEVNNRDRAESIAREVVGDQLGIDDPYSSVVRIDDVQRENRNRSWVVEGQANGAPFVVRIRSSDGSLENFQLY